ncbi:MAG: hypothetical protein M5U31_15725 [Acidimicrobiia bacterium]|nr:hypothetical protein [Acidimicrobiia bacterium]
MRLPHLGDTARIELGDRRRRSRVLVQLGGAALEEALQPAGLGRRVVEAGLRVDDSGGGLVDLQAGLVVVLGEDRDALAVGVDGVLESGCLCALVVDGLGRGRHGNHGDDDAGRQDQREGEAQRAGATPSSPAQVLPRESPHSQHRQQW